MGQRESQEQWTLIMAGQGQGVASAEGRPGSGTKRSSWRGWQGRELGSLSLAGGSLKGFNWVRFLEYHSQIDVIAEERMDWGARWRGRETN